MAWAPVIDVAEDHVGAATPPRGAVPPPRAASPHRARTAAPPHAADPPDAAAAVDGVRGHARVVVLYVVDEQHPLCGCT